MALVYNCNEDVATDALISGLQVTHSFYKHLVKNDVTKKRDILVLTQKYMQNKEATRSGLEAKAAVPLEEESKSQLNCCP